MSINNVCPESTCNNCHCREDGNGRLGHTLLELVIAITVTLIISSLLFAAYLVIIKDFHFYNRKANDVLNTVVLKKKMDGMISECAVITEAFKTSFEFTDASAGNRHTVAFRNDILYMDNKPVITELKSFDYSISDKTANNGKKLLLWEMSLRNGSWIAGAAEVRR